MNDTYLYNNVDKDYTNFLLSFTITNLRITKIIDSWEPNFDLNIINGTLLMLKKNNQISTILEI